MKHIFGIILLLVLILPISAQDIESELGHVSYTDEVQVGYKYSWKYEIVNDTYPAVDDGDTISFTVLENTQPVYFNFSELRVPRWIMDREELEKQFLIEETSEDGTYVTYGAMIYPSKFHFSDGANMTMKEMLNYYYGEVLGYTISEEGDIFTVKGGGSLWSFEYNFNLTSGVQQYFKIVDYDVKSLEFIFLGRELVEENNTSSSSETSVIMIFPTIGLITLIYSKKKELPTRN
ncbi:MAG: hypothetical protein ACXAD7_15135 [Candidatus Kariarchaeaceae archaeon]|jgi:hypothetical protein